MTRDTYLTIVVILAFLMLVDVARDIARAYGRRVHRRAVAHRVEWREVELWFERMSAASVAAVDATSALADAFRKIGDAARPMPFPRRKFEVDES